MDLPAVHSVGMKCPYTSRSIFADDHPPWAWIHLRFVPRAVGRLTNLPQGVRRDPPEVVAERLPHQPIENPRGIKLHSYMTYTLRGLGR